jgi:hypothetical protein
MPKLHFIILRIKVALDMVTTLWPLPSSKAQAHKTGKQGFFEKISEET